jgi:transposase
LDSDIAQLEMRLKDCEEGLGEQIAARPEPERHHAFRPREKSGRKPLRPHLPREVVVHEPEIVCGCDNAIPHVWPSWERSSRRCWRRSLPGSR